MSARLVPLNPGQAPSFLLERPVVLIGRHVDCDLRLDFAQISRRHCCIAHVGDELVLRDLESRHGLLVNGHVVQECPLRNGDELAIAHVLYRLEFFDANAPSAHAPTQADDDLVPLDED